MRKIKHGDTFEAEVTRIGSDVPGYLMGTIAIVTLVVYIPDRVRPYYARVGWSIPKLGREPQIGDAVEVQIGEPSEMFQPVLSSSGRGKFRITRLLDELTGDFKPRLARVFYEPNWQACYACCEVQREGVLPLSIKATFGGIDRRKLKSGTWVTVVRTNPNDARQYRIVEVFGMEKPEGCPRNLNFKKETATMSNERVRFFLGCRYYDNGSKLNETLNTAFGAPSGPGTSWGCIRKMNPNGFSIVCRADQFVKFLILRNKAGITNGFIDLKAEMIEQVPDCYTQLADATGVDRDAIKKVLIALAYSAQDVMDRLTECDKPTEIDVSTAS